MSSTMPATSIEYSLYAGISLQNILYGIELVFYFKTVGIFLGRRSKPHQSDLFFATFSTVMFCLITGWVIVDAVFGGEMWLQYRNYPGGPVAFMIGPNSHAPNTYDAVATIILQQMTDGLMMYRCRTVWDSHRVLIIPLILWFLTIVMGGLGAATRGPDPYTGISILFILAYYTISVFLSVTLTCMICYRLWRHAREVEEYLGVEFASPYLIAATLLIESVLPYTLTGIAFLVTYGVGSTVGIAYSRVYTLMMCVSPQMLILRVAEGNAWHKETMKAPTSVLRFSPGHGDTTDSSSGRIDWGGTELKPLGTLPGAYHPESSQNSDKV